MRTIDTIPKIMKMAVYPVAGYDSMTLTLSGAHAPYFTRNIVVLEDETGQRGVGEIHGGEDITKMLESYIPLVEGQKIADYRQVITTIRKKGWLAKGNDGQGLQGLDLKNMKFVVQAEAAVECAMLDLLGKHLNMPMCTLLGDGRQRAEVEVLGYLFYIADCEKTDLPYLVEYSCKDKWDELRRKETLTPEEIEGCGGEYRYITVTGPYQQMVQAKFGLIDTERAVIEMAQASGLMLVGTNQMNPMEATSYGTGELINEVLAHGVKEIYIGIGGSATNDGGVGMAQALGVSFKDADGKEIALGAKEIAMIDSIDISNINPRLKETVFYILSDVSNPLCGQNGASFIYGKQKGASGAQV